MSGPPFTSSTRKLEVLVMKLSEGVYYADSDSFVTSNPRVFYYDVSSKCPRTMTTPDLDMLYPSCMRRNRGTRQVEK